jgi:dihydroorotate dehydrogenase (NAD+) catalytic subunit
LPIESIAPSYISRIEYAVAVTNPPGALQTDLAGLRLRSPVILAAGTCGTLDEMADALDLSRAGALVTKSITAQPREGNPTWRIIESRAGMLNAIGLANVGVDAFIEHYAPRVRGVPTGVIGSVAGFSIEDYVAVSAAMNEVEGIEAVELNVSCPNVHGGVEFGVDPPALRALVGAVRPVLTRARMFVKLPPIAVGTPGLTMLDVARAAIDGGFAPAGPNGRTGADALCIANTTPAMAIDVRTRRPRLANTTGGLSGPAVHPVAIKLVHEVYRGIARAAGVPLVGIGGVMTWEDAAEFILAGATAVQVGTGLFADPRSPLKIARGLEKWAARQGASSIAELIGAVRLE